MVVSLFYVFCIIAQGFSVQVQFVIDVSEKGNGFLTFLRVLHFRTRILTKHAFFVPNFDRFLHSRTGFFTKNACF